MRKTPFIVCAVLLSIEGPASAITLSVPNETDSLVLRAAATDCRGPIATENRVIFGVKRLAKMRREGKLPGQFICGRCEYDLRGDPAAAYYVKKCR
jgi:hypothetical protein